MSEINNLISGLNSLNNGGSAPNGSPAGTGETGAGKRRPRMTMCGFPGIDFELEDSGSAPQNESANVGGSADPLGLGGLAGLLSSNDIDLPTAKNRPDPSALPFEADTSNEDAGLPSPKVDAGLPSPKINAGMASSMADVGLPSPKINAGMGSSMADVGLPSPKINAGMGSSMADVGLPSPKINAGLPSPKNNAGLPSPKINAGLPSPKNNAGLPSTKESFAAAPKASGYDDFLGLFSDSEPEPPMSHSSLEDSSLGVIKNKNIQAPVLKTDRVAPTGAFSQTHDFDNDSGLPLADDPLSSRSVSLSGKQAPPPSADFLGLFGGAPAAPTASASTPAAPAAPVSTPAAPAAPAEPVSKPVTSAPAATQSSVHQNVGQPVVNDGQVTEAEVDEEGEELVFDLKTIKSNSVSAMPAVAVTTEKKEVKTNPKLKRTIIAVGIILGIAALCFVGALVYISHATEVKDEDLAPIQEVPEVVVNWGLMKNDRIEAYRDVFEKSINKLQQDDMDDQQKSDLRGRALVNMTLASARFFDNFQAEIEILDNSAEEILSKDMCSTSWCAVGLYGWGLLRDKNELVTKYESMIGEEEKTIKNVLETAVAYRKLRAEHTSMLEVREDAEKMLDNISEEALEWPIVAWVAGTSHWELGNFTKAADVAKKANNEGDVFSSSLALLNAKLQFLLDHGDKARLLCEKVIKNEKSSPVDVEEAENLLFEEYVCSAEDKDVIVRVEKELENSLEKPEKIERIVQACIHANRSELCKKPFEIVFGNNSSVMALREGYIRILLERRGYSSLIRPDGNTPRTTLFNVLELLDEGIRQDPTNKTLWRYKVIANYAVRDFEEVENAIVEYEHDEKLVWAGAFIRDLMNYQSGNIDKIPEVRASLKGYASQVTDPLDALVLAVALNYIGNREDADAVINNVLKLHPERTDFINIALDFSIEREEKEVGEKYLQILEARNALMSKQEYDYAKLCYRKGDFKTALEKMIILNEKTSDFPEPAYLSFLGQLFFEEDRCSDAVPYFTQSLNISGGADPETHYFYGRCLQKAGRYEQALTEFNEAANQDDSNRIYILWVGQAYAGLNNNVEAQRAFTEVIDEFNLRSEADKAVYDKFTIGEAYFFRAELGKYKNGRSEVDKDYQQAIHFMPEEIRYYKGYAVFLYENEMLKKCVDVVNKVESISKDKLDSVFYFVRGLSQTKLSKISAAISDLEKARDAGFADLEDSGVVGIRESCEIYERLGYLYREAGNREHARASLKKYLELSKTISASVRRDIQADIDKI